MTKIDLSMCCSDCFDAINFSLSDIPPENREAAITAGKKLSAFTDSQDIYSVTTGEPLGFSKSKCDGCGCELGGERWPLHGLIKRRDN